MYDSQRFNHGWSMMQKVLSDNTVSDYENINEKLERARLSIDRPLRLQSNRSK